MQKPLKDAEGETGLPGYRSWQPLEWVVSERTRHLTPPSWAWQSLEVDAEPDSRTSEKNEDSSKK